MDQRDLRQDLPPEDEMRDSVGLFSLLFLVGMTLAAAAEDLHPSAKRERSRPLDVFRDCDACPEMVVLPTGTFTMGSTVEEANAARLRFFADRNVDTAAYEKKLRQSFIDIGIDPDHPDVGLMAYYASGTFNQAEDPQYSVNPLLHEVPVHEVLIDRPIAMGRNEVTREEWAACVKDGGCEIGLKATPPRAWVRCQNSVECAMTPDDRVRFRLPNGPHATNPRSPMTGLTFLEMKDYTAWLNKKAGGNVYRLPTEAEWEYAARSGTTTSYAQGDRLTLGQANFLVARRDRVNGEFVWTYDLGSPRELLPVDDLDAANAWGLRHMSGNASELTSSCGEGPQRHLSSSSEYLAADAGNARCKRSSKGGSYESSVELTRPARRVPVPVDHWSPSLGFRVVRDLSPDIPAAK